MPLGDDLRADDDIGAAFGNRADRVLQRAGGPEEIRGQNRQPRVGEALGHLLGEPLDPRTNGGEPTLGLAGRAFGRDRFALAALVADEALEEPVLDHPRVTVIAADLMPAGTADRDRRIATPVQEEHRLLAIVDALKHLADQPGRDPMCRLDPLLAHVDCRHLGQLARPEA